MNYDNTIGQIIKMIETIEWKTKDITTLKQIDNKNKIIKEYENDIKNIKEEIKKFLIKGFENVK